jgi:hypothetical protein
MVGPGRSLPPPAEGWSDVRFLHGVRDTVVRDKAMTRLCQEPRKDGCLGRDIRRIRRHQWHKELWHKTAAMSEEGKDNQQRHQRMEQKIGATSGKQEDITCGPRTHSQVGGCKASSQDFQRVVESEWQDIMEGSAPSGMKEETTNSRLRAMDVAAVTILRASAHVRP